LKIDTFLGWITVPCSNEVGSCTYADWCTLCKTCNCPLKAVRWVIVCLDEFVMFRVICFVGKSSHGNVIEYDIISSKRRL